MSGTREFVNPVDWFGVHAQRAVCSDTLKKKSKSKVDLKNIKNLQKCKYKYVWLLFIVIGIIVI